MKKKEKQKMSELSALRRIVLEYIDEETKPKKRAAATPAAKTKNDFFNFNRLAANLPQILNSAVVGILAFFFFYISFSLLVILFDFDNRPSRFLSAYLPVPGMVSSVGFIEYYDYLDYIKKSGQSDHLYAKSKLLSRLASLSEKEKIKAWDFVR